ncbi:DUF1080 domain-containing protein [Prosthecobacter sp.]|uniref:3-keto-disaccharide hydrolase n=1 Tax=Prosthecobacter sp. TaxID=1965333 RepID=UPI001D5F8696|nr:DUF1080 domain-containing protein [Prosthecobacter sp.]MCB1275196.1 DUF1080 domain-containing protein [Prosthecobacter sp.]
MIRFLLSFILAGSLGAQDALTGQWSLDLPNDEKGWLSVESDKVELMCGVGSARPVEKFERQNGVLSFDKSIKRPLAPKEEPTVKYRITMSAEGETLRGTMQPETGAAIIFSGKKQPPMPSAPDLSKVVFGEPITLINGRDLTGWRASNPAKKNGWSVRDGILCNDTPKTDFSAYGEHTNLRSDAEFEDFQLHIEYRLPPETGGNSGIYLRGMYEVQVTHRDSKMQGINGPGAVFGRITPTHNAGKPAGEWDVLDITLVNRHITVVLNGDKVINNQPVPGCTGGALKSDVIQPGPIYLQGDHTSVQYRNLLLRPVRQP